MKKLILFSILAIVAAAQAGFDTYVIRNSYSNVAPTIQTNNAYVSGATEFVISAGGMKAGWGSNDINGSTIGDITQLAVTRYDDTTRFAANTGGRYAPYFNIWVTDGSGNYAVVANEPSNGAFQPLFTSNPDGSKTYDLSYTDLSDKVAKVYETPGAVAGTSWVHNMFGKTSLTFADIASLEIAPPDAAYIQNSANAVTSGAPDELGTDLAYGFTWVFGDTLSNYVSGMEGFVVGSPAAVGAVVPVPGAIVLGGLGVGLVGWMRRRKSL